MQPNQEVYHAPEATRAARSRARRLRSNQSPSVEASASSATTRPTTSTSIARRTVTRELSCSRSDEAATCTLDTARTRPTEWPVRPTVPSARRSRPRHYVVDWRKRCELCDASVCPRDSRATPAATAGARATSQTCDSSHFSLFWQLQAQHVAPRHHAREKKCLWPNWIGSLKQ
jgi:hypothetical protein